MNCDPWISQKYLEIESATFVSDSEGRKRESECPYTISPDFAWQMSSLDQ